MLKQNYKKIIVGLFILIVIVVGYIQYEKQKMYQAYISMQLNNEIASIVSAIVRCNNFYEDILNTGKITKRHVSVLKSYNSDIAFNYKKYNDLAIRFNRLEHRNSENETLENTESILSFFIEISKGAGSEPYEQKELDDVIFKLDFSSRKKIEYMREINLLWMKAAKRNVEGFVITNSEVSFNGTKFHEIYGEKSLSKDFWVDLIFELDKETEKFLTSYHIQNIEELF